MYTFADLHAACMRLKNNLLILRDPRNTFCKSHHFYAGQHETFWSQLPCTQEGRYEI